MGQTSSVASHDGFSITSTTNSFERITRSQPVRIDGYSRTKGIGAGNSTNSCVFTVGGQSWYIACFPEGSGKACAGWISLFLYLHHPAIDKEEDVKAQFSFRLLGKNGEPLLLEYPRISPISTFSFVAGFPPQRWGYNKFIKRSIFQRGYLKHDCLQIQCTVTVFKQASVGTTTVRRSLTVPQPEVPSPDLSHHFGDLLNSQLGADVTFMVSGEQYRAHRVVLAARSSVFKAEPFGQMKEKHRTCIQIDDMDAGVFRAMLQFVYTDSLPNIDERDKVPMAQHLLVSADRYDLDKLKLICKGILLSRVDATNVGTTLVLAEQHGLDALKAACLRFVKSLGSHKVVFMASDGFQHLRSSCPSLLEEVLIAVIPH